MALNNLGLGFVFTARDLASAKMATVERRFASLDDRVTGGTTRMTSAFQQLGIGLAVFTAGAAAVAGALSLANAAGRFEQGLAAVGVVADVRPPLRPGLAGDLGRRGAVERAVVQLDPALVDPPREFCPGLAVTTAPAFRFDGLWHLPHEKPLHDAVTLLVSLPLDAGQTRQILEMLGAAIGRNPDFEGWRVRIKPHPAFPRHQFEKGATMGLKHGWSLAEGDLDDLIEEADLFVGNASSTCVQAIVHGVPVAIVGGRARPTLNPIPEWVDGALWSVCHSADDLREKLTRLVRGDSEASARRREAGASIRERLFRPVTRSAVLELLGLPPAATTLQ